MSLRLPFASRTPARNVVQASIAGGTYDDYSFGLGALALTADHIVITTAAGVNIQGMSLGQSASNPRRVTFTVINNTVAFKVENAGSIAANRIAIAGGMSNSATVGGGNSIDFAWDPGASRWKLVGYGGNVVFV